jgi:hypothetical protein
MHQQPEWESSPRRQRQRQLHADPPAELALDEVLQRVGNLPVLGADTALQLAGDILGSVARPALSWIERDDAEHLVILAGEEVADQRRIVDALIGLTERRAAAEILQDKVEILRFRVSGSKPSGNSGTSS